MEIYQGYCLPTNPEFTGKQIAFTSKKIKTVEIGKNLHLALVTVASEPPAATELLTPVTLVPGAIYSYNLLFFKSANTSTKEDENLISLGLLNTTELLGFIPNQLPSFITAPLKLEDVRIAHGSCRKPHGKGRDGLATLARIIKPDFEEPERKIKPTARPHYFFHTGDQIYADDCSDFLIQYYTDAGNYLLQKVEELPFPKNPESNYSKQGQDIASFNWIQVTSEAFPPGRRATNFYLGCTGSESNHLYSFAEFAAAYLFQWSDVFWPRNSANPLEIELPETEELYFDRLNDTNETRSYLFPLIKEGDTNKDGKVEGSPQVPANWDLLTTAESRRTRFNSLRNSAENESVNIPENKNLKKAFTDYKRSRQKKFPSDEPKEKDLVQDFSNDLKAVRRVSANVPSIMSFDDHDITDDWYLNGGWTKQALGTRLGENIIRNGLCAFSLFQAWGNDPRGWADKTTFKDARSQLLGKIPELINKRLI